MADISHFEGPLRKIKRANQHIAELESLFDDFLAQGDTHAFEAIQPQRYAAWIKKPFPDHTATVIGDAVHNIRASLDHLYVILTRLNNQTPDAYIKFPIRKTKIDIASQMTPKNPNPSRQVMDALLNIICPNDGGAVDQIILAIHDLDIADKHMQLIPVAGEVVARSVVITNPDGTVGITIGKLSFGSQDPVANTPNLNHMFVEGRKVEQKETPTLEIIFGDEQPLSGENVIESLKTMSQAAHSIIATIAKIA